MLQRAESCAEQLSELSRSRRSSRHTLPTSGPHRSVFIVLPARFAYAIFIAEYDSAAATHYYGALKVTAYF
jgi:hypothetical protein